jgi:hypothetical protein
MGMRLRLDPAMTDQQILDRVVHTPPAGSNASYGGMSYAHRQRMLLWAICFAARDKGLRPSDGTGSNQIFLDMEHENSFNWVSIVRDINANSTSGDGGGRTALTGLPLNRLQVMARSVFS